MSGNPTRKTHASWALVTAVAFAVGAAASKRGTSPPGGHTGGEPAQTQPGLLADTAGADYAGSAAGPGAGTTANRAPAPPQAGAGLGGTAPGTRSPASAVGPEPAGDAGGDTGRHPITNQEIEELVLRSIHSADPVERRKAFDRLLAEMKAGNITTEQAMHMRGVMHNNGADGEQWRLFDYAWGASDPATAVAHIDEIPAQFRDGFIGNMIPGLASAHPNEAIDLFSNFDPALQNQVRRRLFEGLVDSGVEVATDYIYDATDPENFHWRPVDTLTREIAADKGVDAAREWAADLADGPLRGSAWSAAYAVLGARAPDAAVEAIIDMPPSPDRNQAINGFISAHAHRDGEAAVIWAAEISEPAMREAAMVRAAQQFYRQNQEAAAEWFVNSGLPAGAWDKVTAGRKP